MPDKPDAGMQIRVSSLSKLHSVQPPPFPLAGMTLVQEASPQRNRLAFDTNALQFFLMRMACRPLVSSGSRSGKLHRSACEETHHCSRA